MRGFGIWDTSVWISLGRDGGVWRPTQAQMGADGHLGSGPPLEESLCSGETPAAPSDEVPGGREDKLKETAEEPLWGRDWCWAGVCPGPLSAWSMQLGADRVRLGFSSPVAEWFSPAFPWCWRTRLCVCGGPPTPEQEAPGKRKCGSPLAELQIHGSSLTHVREVSEHLLYAVSKDQSLRSDGNQTFIRLAHK